MTYSEIFLIAFILLILFASAQIKSFFNFLKGDDTSVKQKDIIAPKTVLTMDDLPKETKHKGNIPSTKETSLIPVKTIDVPHRKPKRKTTSTKAKSTKTATQRKKRLQ